MQGRVNSNTKVGSSGPTHSWTQQGVSIEQEELGNHGAVVSNGVLDAGIQRLGRGSWKRRLTSFGLRSLLDLDLESVWRSSSELWDVSGFWTLRGAMRASETAGACGTAIAGRIQT